DLVVPAAQGTAKGTDLGRMVRVEEVVGELGDEGVGLGRVLDRVDAADGLLRMPCEPDIASGVARREEPEKLRLAAVIESLMGLGEQPTGSIERVVAAAAVAEGLVLDTAAALIELRVGVLHEMERVRDL